MQLFTVILVLSVCTVLFSVNEIIIMNTGLKHSFEVASKVIGENVESTLEFLDKREASRILASLKSEPSFESAFLFDSHKSLICEVRKGRHNDNAT